MLDSLTVVLLMRIFLEAPPDRAGQNQSDRSGRLTFGLEACEARCLDPGMLPIETRQCEPGREDLLQIRSEVPRNGTSNVQAEAHPGESGATGPLSLVLQQAHISGEGRAAPGASTEADRMVI